MKFSQSFIYTAKEAPKDAVLPSHIYLSRAGFITQAASGLYNFLPLGLKVLDKIENVITEEMDAINALKVDLSFVTPVELWEESGRIEKFGKELLRFNDRKENMFVLGPTHEEMMVNVVRSKVNSYKQLPLHLYQIKTKFRDEARPRFGLMRGREFLMKDGYSFHADESDLDREFNAVEGAYKKVLERLGLEYRVVEADSGAIGGSGSKELMVLAQSGEDTIAVCDSCEYGANIEAAKRGVRKETPQPPEAKFSEFKTPGVKTIEDLANFFHIDAYYTMKAVAKKALFDDRSEIVLFFLRGCDQLQEVKAQNAINALELQDVSDEELHEAGLSAGYIGPFEQECTMVFDETLKDAEHMICGANKTDYHRVGVGMAQLGEVDYFDIAQVAEGDSCPCCDGSLSFTKGIEVGHIFKLGDVYSKPLKAEFLDQNGSSKPFVMGTYGMGVSRLVAAVIEQHHDERGCIWTKETAPYALNIMISNIKDDEQYRFGIELYEELKAQGVEVIVDERKERFGFKMKDAELLGFPYTVIVGKGLAEGSIEILERKSMEKSTVSVESALEHIMELMA